MKPFTITMAAALTRLGRPLISLLNNLRYGQKAVLLGLVILIPLGVTQSLLIVEFNKTITFTRKERIGLEYCRLLRTLLQDLQQHRGLSIGFYNKEASFRDRLLNQQARINRDIMALDALDRRFNPELKTTETWNALKSKIHVLETEVWRVDAQRSLREHAALIERILSLFSDLGNTSNLILDPRLDSYHLASAIITILPRLSEDLGQERAVGLSLATRGRFTGEETKLLLLPGKVQADTDDNRRSFNLIFKENPIIRPRLEAALEHCNEAIQSFQELIQKNLRAQDQYGIKTATYYLVATRTIDTVFDLFDKTAPELDAILVARIESYRARRNLAATVSLFALFIVLSLFAAFLVSVKSAISDMTRLAESLSAGDSAVRLEVTSDDEMGDLARHFNKMAEQVGQLLSALNLRRKHAETIISSMPAGLLVLRGDLTVLHVNRAFLETFELSENSATDRPLEDVLPIPGLREAALDVMTSGRAKHDLLFETTINQVHRTLQVTITGTHLAQEIEEERLLVIIEDISEKKRLRELAEAAEERYHAAVENATDGIVVMDQDGRIAYFNRAAERMFGYERGQVLGKQLTSLMPKKHRQSYEETLARYLQTNQPRAQGSILTLEGLRKDGSTFPMDSSISAYSLGTGTAFTGILRDISEKVLADERLRLQAAALDAIADPVIVTDQTGAILSVNAAFASQNGWPVEEILGKNPRFLKSGLNDDAYPGMWKTILAGKTWMGEVSNRRKDGSVYIAQLTITPIRDASGAICQFVSTHRDITEARKTEAALHAQETQLRQAQKMEAVGRLAGGIAHDFNNLLTAILGRSAFLLEELEPGHPSRSDVLEIKAAGTRAASLTMQLLAFSRKQMLKPTRLNLNVVVREIHNMLRRLIGEDIELKLLPCEKPTGVLADRGQIDQVIMNLVLNSRDAMPNGGKILIETRPIELKTPKVHRHGSIPRGSYMMMSVSDTGTGMSEAVQAHLFEPFFTTKEQGKGTGLGLPTVYGITAQSGGHIAVSSEEGRGTTFTIYLPSVGEKIEDGETETHPTKLPRGSGVILLVEDEPAVRELVNHALTSNGFTVIATGDPLEAIAICERPQEPIRMLVTDVVMPKLNGLQMSKKIKIMRPELPVLYISGYTEHSVLLQDIAELKGEFLQKPFEPRALLEKVHAILGARPQADLAGA